MEIKKYVEYIRECKKRGFDNFTIKDSLLKKGWPENEVNSAFSYIASVEALNKKNEPKKQEYNGPAYPGQSFGSSITIFLDDDLRNLLEKRAKKNMLSLPEQVEDILRRSTINQKGKKSPYDAKVDDKLVGAFSRQNTGPKRKKKKAKVNLTEEQRRKARKEERVKRRAERIAKRKAKKRK
jgi:hypothetical protein